MFKKWFSRTPKETKETKEAILLNGLQDQLGWIIFSVDNDGIINMDFDFGTDKRSNENFSELFDQINNGDLLKTSVAFIQSSLKQQERMSDLEEFNENTEVLKKMRNDILSDLLTQENEEVVVKPTDIAKLILKDEDK
jgi:hypothetical protein|tara:strand:- start:2339 stop:2752 length:414 start_codon:yes stop_codon:yes gene_type:complete